MDNIIIIPEKLIKAELELNDIIFDGAPCGSLLSYYHTNLYKGNIKPISVLLFVALLFREILIGLMTPFCKQNFREKKILFGKTANRIQFNSLIDPLKDVFCKHSIIFMPNRESEFKKTNFYKSLKVKRAFGIIYDVLKSKSRIKRIYRDNGIPINTWIVLYTLFKQLVSYTNWVKFFEVNNFKCVMVDYDRKRVNSVIVIAAKRKKIPVYTLQHGVLNGIFGYYPILANKICVWGNFHKRQLLSFGLSASQIEIVGNPIAKKVIKNDLIQNKKSKKRLVFGVGINPTKEKENILFIKYLLSFDIDVQWIFRLHPAMKLGKWSSNFQENRDILFEIGTERPISSFFTSIDLLIVGNSGIGFEAILNNIPVWVYKVSQTSLENDFVMIENGFCPDVTSSNNFIKEYAKLKNDNLYLRNILAAQKSFLEKDFYNSYGNTSTDHIIDIVLKCIKQ